MASSYHSVVSWLQNHTLGLSLVLFVLGCLVSLFAAEIRSFIRDWPKTWRQFWEKREEHHRRLIKNLHNNSYQLTLWFVWNIIDLFVWAFTVNSFVVVLSFPLHLPVKNVSVWSTLSGLLVGRVFNMRTTLNDLYRYKTELNDEKSEQASAAAAGAK